MKIYLSLILACVLAIPLVADASNGRPPSLGCDDIFPDCATKPELQAAYDDLQGQIDTIELTPGPQGEQGVAGQDGADGQDGIDGQDGAQGIQGEQGIQGIQGEKGDQGEQGIAGVDGVDGLDGADGVDGVDGIDGVDGAKGDKGDQGIAGIDGQDGIDGIDGEDGLDADMSIVNANTAAIGVNSQAIDAVNSNSIARDEGLSSRIDQNRSLIEDNAEEIEWIKGELEELEDAMHDGVSQAMAMGIIPDAENGRFGFGVGCASYHSKDNCAVGLAWTNADGRHKLKSAFTEDGASAGYMYSF